MAQPSELVVLVQWESVAPVRMIVKQGVLLVVPLLILFFALCVHRYY